MIWQLLAASVVGFALASPAWADDPEGGLQVFKKRCQACHMIGPEARNRVGPQLNALFGRTAGSVDGYKYSKANKESGIVWSEENFAEYIVNPRAYIPGTKMVFALKKPDKIPHLVAYLRQFEADGSVAEQPAQ